MSDRPEHPVPAARRPIADGPRPRLSDDAVNNGFVAGLIDGRRGRRLGASRRTFLRSTLAVAAASSAATVTNLFGPARRVSAQTGVIGTYPRRLLTYCPPYNSDDNCQPGCGSSPICTDCCDRDGYFRNEPQNGYSLYPGGCGDGDIADGWIWRYNDVCGNCAAIEYRCSDGYVETDTGPAPFICRVVTDCVPLAEGQAGNHQPDLAVQTDWRPAGALEQAIDNGGSVTMTGWVADATGQPVDLRVTANNQIVHIGKAGLARPDVASSVRGAGPNTGYSVSFPLEPGPYRLCINALKGAISVTIGCVNLDVGSGQAVRGGPGDTTIGGLPDRPAPTPTPTVADDDPSEAPIEDPTGDDAGDQTEDRAEADAAGAPLVAIADTPSEHETLGAVQVIRRTGDATGFVSGWAGDADTDEPVWVDVRVDGVSAAVLRPDLARPDVAAAFPAFGASTGFAGSFVLPATEADVCVDLVDPDDGRRSTLGCRRLGAAIDTPADAPGPETGTGTGAEPISIGDPLAIPDVVWGALDAVEVDGTDLVLRGWALAPNEPDRIVEVRGVAGGVATVGTTGLEHAESQRRYGFDQQCGFELRVPASQGEHAIRVEAATLLGSHIIGESTVTVP